MLPCCAFSRSENSYGLGAPLVSHWHAIVLEGGFDENGNFIHIPFGNLQEMTEGFRRAVIKLFLECTSLLTIRLKLGYNFSYHSTI